MLNRAGSLSVTPVARSNSSTWIATICLPSPSFRTFSIHPVKQIKIQPVKTEKTLKRIRTTSDAYILIARTLHRSKNGNYFCNMIPHLPFNAFTTRKKFLAQHNAFSCGWRQLFPSRKRGLQCLHLHTEKSIGMSSPHFEQNWEKKKTLRETTKVEKRAKAHTESSISSLTRERFQGRHS